ncbi:cation transporter [Salinisphaera orenii MK-B5]|uniref:Cation transporter n=2 Tax=Salinisphaera orenii TaxID=856731 RepID=A0A423PY73_9GAMM|nr:MULTISPECIES: cation diffusion facilitator family transporter [Salinisphaera]ROO23122.1 cation transporter [Salinisphaera halophila YIM 95161]ROO30533.1 cation transporter [Salinisphaera orenii MK-B5]
MTGCCDENDAHLQQMRSQQARMLWMVLAINAAMFLFEFTAGWWAASTALLGDSLDMLGDSLVYGLSLFVVARSARWKAVSAGFKGMVMLIFGLLVLSEAINKVISGHTPQPTIMAVVGMLALAANVLCLLLLTRHRDDDVNMQSSWICSRNDLFANTGVILAAGLVALTGSIWPDIIVGAAIATLFLYSAFGVLREARLSFASSTPPEESPAR